MAQQHEQHQDPRSKQKFPRPVGKGIFPPCGGHLAQDQPRGDGACGKTDQHGQRDVGDKEQEAQAQRQFLLLLHQAAFHSVHYDHQAHCQRKGNDNVNADTVSLE